MKFNRKLIIPSVAAVAIPVVAAVSLLGLTGSNESQGKDRAEQRISLDQAPAAVRAAVERERQGGTLKEFERTTMNDKTAYTADIEKDGKVTETVIGEDGQVLRRGPDSDDEDDDD